MYFLSVYHIFASNTREKKRRRAVAGIDFFGNMEYYIKDMKKSNDSVRKSVCVFD